MNSIITLCLLNRRRLLGSSNIILLFRGLWLRSCLVFGLFGILYLSKVNIRIMTIFHLKIAEKILGIIPQLFTAHIRGATGLQLIHFNAHKIHCIKDNIRYCSSIYFGWF